MADSADKHPHGVSRRRFLQGAAGGAAYLAGSSLIGRVAQAQGQAAGSNVIVDENGLTAGRTSDFRLSNWADPLRGFATATSVDLGEAVELKLIKYDDVSPSAEVRVYRLGYYGGLGGRLVHTGTLGPVPGFAEQGDGLTPPGNFGLRSFADWDVTYTIPADDLPVSGMYLARVIIPNGPGGQPGDMHIPFVVRDDARDRDLLVVMPTNTWQAYNNWPNRSLYVYNSFGADTVAGSSRAVKVSFDRPWSNYVADYNWVLRTEFPLIWWLEQQGFDIAYTDDFGMHSQPLQLRLPRTKTLVIAGHSEYWTKEMRDNVDAARDAGTNIASFSANSAYWQVRYEDAGRTLVCFKTVQSRDVDSADGGEDGVNDFGPGALTRPSPSDPLGADQARGGTGANADNPALVTTTFRDAGANANAPGAPDADPPREFEGSGRVGPDRPENGLFGVLYIGDDDITSFPLAVPAAGSGGPGEFGSHPAWRHTAVADGAARNIGSDLIGWEWDAIPGGGAYASYVSRQPPGVKRLAETVPDPALAQDLAYLRDEGHDYSDQPDPGQGAAIHAVTYRAQSGAYVFASGTMQWSWGLGPHFEAFLDNGVQRTYESNFPAEDSYSALNGAIAQATYNILVDGGVSAATPVGVVKDPPPGAPPPDEPGTGPPKVTPRDVVPPALRLKRGRRRVRSGGVVRVRVACPASEPDTVRGRLSLIALVPRRSRSGRRLKPRRVRLGSAGFEIRPGRSRLVNVKLSKRGRTLMRARPSVTVVAEAQARDVIGNTGLTRVKFRLAALRRRTPGDPR